ncbi:hypothetical protein WT71_10645 [Burkholderia stagnalis]|nr:hypothetical protein WT71_10645 [Burkholderia stagnalis]KWI72822.1 hypothetical protein WT73_11315 [Burkholderia stagnalis]
MGIIVAELAKGVLKEPYNVRVYLGPVGKWQIALTTQSGRLLEVETREGTPKTWRVFEDAMEVVIASCKEAQEVRVEVGPLVLVEQRSGA